MANDVKDKFNLSYWEANQRSSWDLTVIGAGIVGLHAAMEFKRARPDARVLVLERGISSFGASTKNAGFVCFGSVSELIQDIENIGKEACIQLIRSRFRGAEYIRNDFDPSEIDLLWDGSFECFGEDQGDAFNKCLDQLASINEVVYQATGLKDQFTAVAPPIGMNGLTGCIHGRYEGQLNPAKWMNTVQERCRNMKIRILNGVRLKKWYREEDDIKMIVEGEELSTQKLIIATNGYMVDDRSHDGVTPVKNQVLVTGSVGRTLSGTYHMDRGFIYFRGVGDRILIGGGRNIDETSHTFDYNMKVEEHLLNILKQYLSLHDVSIEKRWIGRLGVGASKEPLIDTLDHQVFRAVRLGGMGVAIGAQVGKMVAQKALHEDA